VLVDGGDGAWRGCVSRGIFLLAGAFSGDVRGDVIWGAAGVGFGGCQLAISCGATMRTSGVVGWCVCICFSL
jgi:hypothetical protein